MFQALLRSLHAHTPRGGVCYCPILSTERSGNLPDIVHPERVRAGLYPGRGAQALASALCQLPPDTALGQDKLSQHFPVSKALSPPYLIPFQTGQEGEAQRGAGGPGAQFDRKAAGAQRGWADDPPRATAVRGSVYSQVSLLCSGRPAASLLPSPRAAGGAPRTSAQPFIVSVRVPVTSPTRVQCHMAGPWASASRLVCGMSPPPRWGSLTLCSCPGVCDLLHI